MRDEEPEELLDCGGPRVMLEHFRLLLPVVGDQPLFLSKNSATSANSQLIWTNTPEYKIKSLRTGVVKYRNTE
jgi:hypothetical protein